MGILKNNEIETLQFLCASDKHTPKYKMSTNASFSSKSRLIMRCVLPYLLAWSKMAPLYIFLYGIDFGILAGAEIRRILMINEATVAAGFNSGLLAFILRQKVTVVYK